MPSRPFLDLNGIINLQKLALPLRELTEEDDKLCRKVLRRKYFSGFAPRRSSPCGTGGGLGRLVGDWLMHLQKKCPNFADNYHLADRLLPLTRAGGMAAFDRRL